MTQAEQIKNHLYIKGKITSAEAISLYGITRLAEVVRQVRKKYALGVLANYKKGVRCARYAEYYLAEAA